MSWKGRSSMSLVGGAAGLAFGSVVGLLAPMMLVDLARGDDDEQELVEVVVVQRDVAAYETIAEADLARRKIHARLAGTSAVPVEKAQYVLDALTFVPLSKRDPVRWSHLSLNAEDPYRVLRPACEREIMRAALGEFDSNVRQIRERIMQAGAW